MYRVDAWLGETILLWRNPNSQYKDAITLEINESIHTDATCYPYL